MKQLYFVVFLFSTSFSIAQTDSTKVGTDSLATLFSITEAAKQYLPNYAPLSPNAASFQKFGDYSVNLATGLPTIEIPLYIVKAGGLELPITLSYHASGHKINELSPWVGWGWGLNYGAALSRSINRNADDMNVSNGSYLSNSSFSKNVCLNINDKNEAEMARVGSWDTEPDLLSYSTPESGGKFMLRTGGQPPFMMPWQATKINKITDTGFNKIKAFEVINPSGNLYYFGIDQNGNEATESISSGNSYEGFPVDGIVSWHLTKVLSPTSDDAIYCYYQDGGSLQQKLSSWSGSINYDLVGVPLSAAMIPQEYILARTNTQKNIQKIVFPNGEVEFIQSAAGVRLDSGSPCLQTINIYSFENGVKTLRKRINFIYSYFTDRLGNNGRLKLDQLIFLDENLANPQIHTFEYETNHYSWFYDGNNPSDMVNQDYFGYFNNKGNTHTIDAASFGVGSNIVQVAGGAADRSTVEQYMKEGVLNKIKFPTGGFTTFQYEANQYKNNGGIKIGGGLRVKEIKSFTDVSTMATRKTYTYGSSDGAGIGKTTVELNTPIYQTAGIFYPTGTYYTATINSNGFSEGSYDGTPIYYEFAAETQQTPTSTGNGRTEYTYSFERDIAISTPDYATRSIHPWRRGLLLTEKTYAENATLVKEVSNVYQELKTETILNSGKFFYFGAANWPSGCPSGLLQGFTGGTNTVPMFKYASATNATGNNKLSQKTETIDGVTTITNYSYDNYLLPIKTISDNSQAASFHIKTSIFPTHSSYNANSIAIALRSQNRIGIPLETIEKDSTAGVTTTVFHQKTVYDSFAGTNSRNLLNNILPKEIWVAPTNGGLEKRVEFVSYDTNGNPTEYKVDGRSTSLVWGYNGSLLLGHVQNATASEVTTALATAGIYLPSMSVSYLSTQQIGSLQTLKNYLPASNVTWFAHRPLVGVSQQIIDNQLVTSYHYDSFQRLSYIKNNTNAIEAKYTYFYATTSTQPPTPSNLAWDGSRNSCNNTDGSNSVFRVYVTGIGTGASVEFSIDNTNWYPANLGTDGYQVSVPYAANSSQYFAVRPSDNPINGGLNGWLTKCAFSGGVAPPTVAVASSSLCSVSLSAAGCGGTVTWSNGSTGASLNVNTTTTTTYTATCTVGSTTSSASTALTVPVLPSGWSSAAIGNPTAGCTQVTNGNAQLLGNGAIAAGSSDAFHYVYKQLSGDFTMIAKISNIPATDGNRAGIMLRNSLNPTAADYTIFQDGNTYVGLFRRESDGANNLFSGYQQAALNSTWLKLVKTGNSLTYYFSTNPDPEANNAWSNGFVPQNGATFPQVIPFANTYLLGIATWGNASQATFSNITINGQTL